MIPFFALIRMAGEALRMPIPNHPVCFRLANLPRDSPKIISDRHLILQWSVFFTVAQSLPCSFHVARFHGAEIQAHNRLRDSLYLTGVRPSETMASDMKQVRSHTKHVEGDDLARDETVPS
jgi:hypothetical protein